MRGFFRVPAVAAAALFLAPVATAAGAPAATAQPAAGVPVLGETPPVTTAGGLAPKPAASGIGIIATHPATVQLTAAATKSPMIRHTFSLDYGQFSTFSQRGE